jgi:post-segregation antitoxin (ccd killing protein)
MKQYFKQLYKDTVLAERANPTLWQTGIEREAVATNAAFEEKLATMQAKYDSKITRL